MWQFYSIVCKNCKPIKRSYFIMLFAATQFFISNLPNFNSITTLSFAAAVMSLRYVCMLLFYILLNVVASFKHVFLLSTCYF